MYSLPFKNSFFYKESSKKYVKNIFTHIPIVTTLLVFSLLMLQPYKFQVIASEEQGENKKEIQKIYQEMLANSQQENTNGEIQFETLLVGENGETKISYTVSPGDNLSKIAKLFGTTIDAIKTTNHIYNDKALRIGTKLTITYDKSIIYDIEKDISVKEFAKKYNISLQDLLTLNYLNSGDDIMKSGQQIFVPLNKIEAEERGLIKKKRFVMLDIPKPINIKQKMIGNNENYEENLIGKKIKKENSSNGNIKTQQQVILLSGSKYQQKIISAEDTKKYLQQLNQARKEAEIAEKRAEEAKKQAEEAKKQALLKKQEEKITAEKIAAEKEEKARLAQIEANKKTQLLKQAEEREKERQQKKEEYQKQLQQQYLSNIEKKCTNQQCYYDGKCWSKPKYANCAPKDDNNAWVCKDGFIDTGRTCITKEEQAKKVAKATAPKRKAGVLKQRYFNPYKKGYSNGRGGGHCTHYAGYYRSSKLGKETNWRGNAKYRYANASAAGRRVGQTPTINSIIVMKYGSQGWNGYGHVGIVIDIDWASRQVLIEDMNYVGRYIVSQHRIDLDSTRNPVIGFVYPD